MATTKPQGDEKAGYEPIGVGHPVRSIATGRLGVIREITEHGYVVKFGGRGTTFVRFDVVRPA